MLTFPRARYPCGIPLDHPLCLIALPIAPDAVFFASAKDKVRKMTLSKITLAVNEETIGRSTDAVYAFDTSLRSFVKPRIEAKAKNTWEPGVWPFR